MPADENKLKTIGERLKGNRKQAGLTQKQLGERIGVSGSMIAQYEAGTRKPKLETIKRLAEALNIPLVNLSLIPEALRVPSVPSYPTRNTFDESSDDIKDHLKKQKEKELDEQLVEALMSLDHEQEKQVLAFIAGLKARTKLEKQKSQEG